MQDHDGGVPGSEEARGKAEKVPGIADRAYRESLGLTAPEFVDLRRIKVQKEIVQHSPAALTVIMGLELVASICRRLQGAIRIQKRETERQGPLLLRLSCSYFTSHTQ